MVLDVLKIDQSVKMPSDIVFIRISAAALLHFFAPQVRGFFESGGYLNFFPDKFTFSIFLFNDTLSMC